MCWLLIHHYHITVLIPTCDKVHSRGLYSAAPLGNQAASTMVQYPTQLHYPDTELTSPRPILLLPGTRLGSDKYQWCSKSLAWLYWEMNSPFRAGEVRTLSIRPLRPVRQTVGELLKTGLGIFVVVILVIRSGWNDFKWISAVTVRLADMYIVCMDLCMYHCMIYTHV